MAMTSQKKKKMCEALYKWARTLDPDGRNEKYFREQFEKMDLNQFDKFCKKFFEDEDANFNFCFQHYENDLTLDNIKRTANLLDLPLFERIKLNQSPDSSGEVYYTQQAVPVFPIHIKRVEHMVSKKNSMSISTNKRNPKTGQVTGADKNGRVSDMENIALVTLNSEAILKEFNTVKADDMVMKREAFNQIQNDGYLDLDKIKSSPMNKTSLNTLDVFYISAGIKTDLVTPGLLLKKTLKNMNKTKESLNAKGQKQI